MSELEVFLTGWSGRFRDGLLAALRAHATDLAGQRVYALAVTTADGGTVPQLCAHTREMAAERGIEVTAEDVEELEPAWWPDEWDHYLTAPELSAASAELADWAGDHDDLSNDENGWSPAWVQGVQDAQCAALGSAEVRACCAEHGWQPVLFVTDTDAGPDGAWQTLNRLNADHPDPDLVAAARRYWNPANW